MSCESSTIAFLRAILLTSAVPTEVRARYIAIIDAILDSADLTSITTKAIRQGIQDQVEYDITPQKVGPLIVGKEVVTHAYRMLSRT